MSDITRALSALCHLDPGMPIDQWHAAGRAAIAAGLSIDDIDDWSSAASNYRGRRDVEMQFSKVTPDGGTTEATLFRMAFDAGWQDPAKGQKGQGTRQIVRPKPKAKPPEKIAPRPNLAAAEFWASLEPATSEDAYIITKRGIPDGLRKVGAGGTATVAVVKSPPIVYAQQVNQTSAPQQTINNGAASSQARRNENGQSKLMDGGTAGEAIGGDSSLETVGVLDRAKDLRG